MCKVLKRNVARHFIDNRFSSILFLNVSMRFSSEKKKYDFVADFKTLLRCGEDTFVLPRWEKAIEEDTTPFAY